MAAAPEPLAPGVLLSDRFEIVRVLGRGGFGIAYLAHDRARHEDVVVKELAPEGATRTSDGLLEMDGLGAAAAHRLRRCFLDEAKLLARLNLPGIANVRTHGVEAGTAFYVTEYFADAKPLDSVLRRSGRLPVDQVLGIGFQLMDTLEAVHSRNILHRDLKPANVLLRPSGEALLIDFGAAREWHADMTEHHTVLFTPGFAPLEQLSEHGKRGPASDVYGLCALLYTLLTGFPPSPATDRLNGVTLTPLTVARVDLDANAAGAIESGLALHYGERPQTIAELRARFSEASTSTDSTSLEALDAKLVALRRLRFGKHECPSCAGILHTPKPLRRGQCPVCNRGSIVARPINAGRCPACRASVLRYKHNRDPLVICPLCDVGVLQARRARLIGKERLFDCPQCEAHFVQRGADVTLESGGQGSGGRKDISGEIARGERLPDLSGNLPRRAKEVLSSSARGESGHAPNPEESFVGQEAGTWEYWATRGHRPAEIYICEGCHAQYDVLSDGQWQQIVPTPGVRQHRRLYPVEWARVAAGLDPGCGTHVCTTCDADYFVEGERMTLLGAFEDPFLFAEANAGRLLTWEALRWLGAGKFSQRAGSTCEACGTEFDDEGDYLRLVRTSDTDLFRFIDTLQTFEDWHRIARALPRVDEEDAFEVSIEAAIRADFMNGKIGFGDCGMLWEGPAIRLSDEASGTLIIRGEEISFGGRLRRERTPLEVLSCAEASGPTLTLRFRGNPEPVEYEVDEAQLSVHLASGDRLLELDASDLAARLNAVVGQVLVN